MYDNDSSIYNNRKQYSKNDSDLCNPRCRSKKIGCNTMEFYS